MMCAEKRELSYQQQCRQKHQASEEHLFPHEYTEESPHCVLLRALAGHRWCDLNSPCSGSSSDLAPPKFTSNPHHPQTPHELPQSHTLLIEPPNTSQRETVIETIHRTIFELLKISFLQNDHKPCIFFSKSTEYQKRRFQTSFLTNDLLSILKMF